MKITIQRVTLKIQAHVKLEEHIKVPDKQDVCSVEWTGFESFDWKVQEDGELFGELVYRLFTFELKSYVDKLSRLDCPAIDHQSHFQGRQCLSLS